METLAGTAMAVLGVQGLVPTQLILHPPTMTARLVFHIEVLIIVDPIRNTRFPLVKVLVTVAIAFRASHPSGHNWLIGSTDKRWKNSF